MKPFLDVVAGVIWQDGRYLAVERPEGARMAGWWEFPGGKIEPDESAEEALVRELHEELAIEATEIEAWRSLEHEYEEFVVRLHFFHVRRFDGQPQSMENQRMEWVDPNATANLEFLPADLPIVNALHGS